MLVRSFHQAILLQNLIRQRVDGILLASCGHNSEQIKTIVEQGTPSDLAKNGTLFKKLTQPLKEDLL